MTPLTGKSNGVCSGVSESLAFFFFLTRSHSLARLTHCVAQADLELTILLPQHSFRTLRSKLTHPEIRMCFEPGQPHLFSMPNEILHTCVFLPKERVNFTVRIA